MISRVYKVVFKDIQTCEISVQTKNFENLKMKLFSMNFQNFCLQIDFKCVKNFDMRGRSFRKHINGTSNYEFWKILPAKEFTGLKFNAHSFQK